MDKKEIILASFAAEPNSIFSPVQIQKLLFIIEKKIANRIGGPFYNFQPYLYGPYDKDIYNSLNELHSEKYLNKISDYTWYNYSLTNEGYEKGFALFNGLEHNLKDYLKALSKYVRSRSFSELVTDIYNEFPEMKINSIFN